MIPTRRSPTSSTAIHEVADRCDAVVIVGSDYTDVTTPSELDTNARIAANLGAPVVLAVKAKDRTPTEVAQVVELCLIEISGQHAHTAAVVANRCEPSQMAAVAEALEGLPAEVVRDARRAAAGRARGGRPCSAPSTAPSSAATPNCSSAR